MPAKIPFKGINLIAIIALASMVFSCSLNDPGSLFNTPQVSTDDVFTDVISLDVSKRTSGTEWVYCEVKEVDISRYPNIDSIVFTTNLRSQLSTEKCIVELYDFDRETSVLYSQVDANVRYFWKYVESQDILATFPKEPTNLGIRLKSSAEGNFVEVGSYTEIVIYSH